MSIVECLITRRESSFLVRISGDSMTDAGIMEGDMAIAEEGRDPRSGDIVLVEVDGEWTMRHFLRKGEKVFLEAANSKYPAAKPKGELRLGGIITAVIRKYHL